MNWSSPEAVEYLLKDKEVFWKNYCSQKTKEMIGNARINNLEFIKELRLVIKKLTELMPKTAHNSSSQSGTKHPLIVTGRYENNISLKIGIGCDNRQSTQLRLYSGDDVINENKLPGKCEEWKRWGNWR